MTRQQAWASGALLRVSQMKGNEKEKKYATLCMKGPALLKQCGLIQTIAFLLSRSESDAGTEYGDHLAQVFIGANRTGADLRQMALEANDLSSYLALSREMAQVAMWFRRFAQSELKASTTDEGEHS